MTQAVSFRRWLVAQVEATSFARDRIESDQKLQKLAKRLGVQVDVLLEARVNEKMRLAGVGLSTGYPGMGLELDFAKEPWEAWQRHLAAWGVTGSTLMRSLVHLYLQGNYEPPLNLSRSWLWDNRQLPVERGGVCREKTRVTHAAKAALSQRAALRGESVAGVLRALVVENMKGKFGKRGLIQLVEVRHMFGDRDRYMRGLK